MTTHNIRAVVFDLDGLMLNTEDVFEQAGSVLVRRRDREMTLECHHAMLGRRPHEAFELMCELLDIDEPIEDLLDESREIFTAMLDDMLAPMPGLFDLLEHLEERELPKGVATSSPRSYMTDMLERYKLLSRFVMTLTAEDVSNGKPHPEIYLKAAETLNVDPGEMLVLEDSEAGTRSAAAAGTITVAVPNRHTRVQDLSSATYVFDSLEDDRLRQLFGV